MGKTSAPPLNGEAIRQARVRRFLTQSEVQEQCAALGVDFERSGLSYIENGKVKRPSLKVVRVLAQVLGMEADEMFKAEDGEEDGGDEESEAA